MKRFQDANGKFFVETQSKLFYVSVENATAFLADKKWADSLHLMSNGEYYKYMPGLKEV